MGGVIARMSGLAPVLLVAAMQTSLFQLSGAGVQSSPHLGSSLAVGPDVDGDGVPDPLVGALYVTSFPNAEPTRVFLMSKSTTLKTVYGGVFGFWHDQLGTSVAWIGDANGDSIPDFASGAPLGPAQASQT